VTVVEWSGVEWSGVEWSGVEWSGVELYGKSKHTQTTSRKGKEGRKEGRNESKITLK
jgi:hypothetical protein